MAAVGVPPVEAAIPPSAAACAPAVPEPLAGDLSALRAVCPTIVLPSDPEYDAARDAWNKDIIGRPSVIARPANAAEVAGVVRWAVACGAPMCVAAGRHSIYASRSNTLMLDLSRLTQLEVDAAARTAQVGPGIKLAAFDAACSAHGLATTAGTNPDTGVAGLTLGGGFGFLCRRHGLTIDNLLEAEVVLLDGRIVVASEASPEFSDLFWALRGGGGNFGIVTRFKYRLHPRGPVLLHLAVHLRTRALGLLPGAHAVARRWRDWAAGCPEESFPFLVLPAGGPLISFAPWVGDDLEQGKRVLAKDTHFGTAVHRETKEAPYGAGKGCLQSFFADKQGPGYYYDTSLVLDDAPDELLDALLAVTETAPVGGKECVTLLMPLGGEVARVPATSTAFGHRAAKYWCISLAKWEAPAGRDGCVRWMRRLKAALSPWLAGTYNTLAAMEGSDAVAYGRGPNAARLAELKAKYDLANFLRQNNNIVPAAAPSSAVAAAVAASAPASTSHVAASAGAGAAAPGGDSLRLPVAEASAERAAAPADSATAAGAAAHVLAPEAAHTGAPVPAALTATGDAAAAAPIETNAMASAVEPPSASMDVSA